jgi:urease accessory protein UreF
MAMNEEMWIALQLCDSSFPGGALANSNGLESAFHHGFVFKNDVNSLKMYINLVLEQVD